MNTIFRYISRGFAATFATTLTVFTFVMSVGVLFRTTDLVVRGVGWQAIGAVVWCGLPSALAFAIPVSALTSTLLLFGRLSADGEITAMRASGISLWQVLAAPLLAGVALAGVCLYINNELAPANRFRQRALIGTLGVDSPLEMLDTGRWMQSFEGLSVYLGRRRGNRVGDVRIYDQRTPGLKREVRAAAGVVHVTNRTDLVIEMQDVRVDPLYEDRPGPGFAGYYAVRIRDAFRQRTFSKRREDMSFLELRDNVRDFRVERKALLGPEEVARERMRMAVELNKRLVLAASCVAFVILGMPLGIRAHRRESSIGVAISLFFVFNFYLFVIVAQSLAARPQLRPDLIVWAPVAVSLGMGWALIRRAQ